jgi:Fuc2NAc and GlcNAc transferase
MSGENFFATAFVVTAGILCWYLTGRMRNYAIAWQILDVPNGRSSHSVPTPRGGGIAVACTVIGLMVIQTSSGLLPANIAAALIGGGLLLALVGWCDDRWGTRPVPRLAAHAAAAIWGVYWVGGLPSLAMGPTVFELGVFGFPLACVAVMWLINLYNFMDGIDGLSGSEAVVVGAAGAMLLYVRGSPSLALVSATVAAASAGFLVWNWPPARIFLGDAGSGLLGYVFAILALASERSGTVPAVVWAMLLAVFVVDSTVTLIRRILRRDPIIVAHKNHAYQRAVQSGLSHRQVTTAVITLNVGLVVAALMAILRADVTGWLAAGVLASMLAGYAVVELRKPMTAERYPSRGDATEPPRPVPDIGATALPAGEAARIDLEYKVSGE